MCQVSKYINPFTDFGFKKIFGDRNSTELLKSLLNDILKFEGRDKIKEITFKNEELLPEAPEERKAIIDLMCEDEKGNEFIVELQDDIIKKAFDKAEFASMPKSQQENYHKNLKVYRDLVNSIDFAVLLTIHQ